MVTFDYCTLLWVSKLQTDISLSTINYFYVALSRSVRELLTLKILIKEVIYNLVIVNKGLKFVSSYTVYEGNNGEIVVATSPSMTTTSKHIDIKYHWFRQHVGKEFLIWKIDSEK